MLSDRMEMLLSDGVIDRVVARLKSGKEADIYLVEHGGSVLAAKLYKDRQHRSFKHSAAYQEGRSVRNTRTERAISKGSRFGHAAREQAWRSAEADALFKLHAQGVRVPRPVQFYEGVLLMDLVLDAEGRPAPRLVDIPLTAHQASEIYEALRREAVKMLCSELIHGDLSPYNVLLAHDGPVIIDFPQVVGAAHNSQAEALFRRDIENVRRFLSGFDPSLHTRAGDAGAIWRSYVRRELHPDFIPDGQQAHRALREKGERSPREPGHAMQPGEASRRRGRRRRGRNGAGRGAASGKGAPVVSFLRSVSPAAKAPIAPSGTSTGPAPTAASQPKAPSSPPGHHPSHPHGRRGR